MSLLFLSYRRSDSQDVTGRIYDRLVAHFGPRRVFKDVDNIPVGVRFPDFLRLTLADAGVLLVVIGPTWLRARADSGEGRRLDDAEDFVRLEVETAIHLGKPLVPVLVSGAAMPPATELPPGMRALVTYNGIPVRPDPDFHRDMDRLIQQLSGLLGTSPDEAGGGGSPPDAEGLVRRLWGSFEPELQDALSLAYNQARREGKKRISTRTFFAAVVRLRPEVLRQLLDQLPEGSLPEPIAAEVPVASPILEEPPLLSPCVQNALVNLERKADPEHKLTPADVFVDVAKHGSGSSVARLREHGVTEAKIDQIVERLGVRVTQR